MASLRVLCVLPGLMIGGAERFVLRVSPLLRDRGIDLEVCVLQPSGPLLEVLRSSGVPFHLLEFRKSARITNLPKALRTIVQLGDLIRRDRFTVVHTYLFTADVAGAFASRLANRVRFIESRRAMAPFRHEPRRLFYILETASNFLADELVANSWAVLRDVEARERLLPRIRTVIHNGVAPDDFEVPVRTHDGPLRLLTIGALEPRKGIDLALSALKHLADRRIRAQYRVVGGGREEGSLRSMASRLGVEQQVDFYGADLDVRKHLHWAEMLVLPSRQEGFSNALLEAMASGLPVVATDAGGNSEAIVDGKGGYITPPEDPIHLAAAIEALADQRVSLETFGNANRLRVQEHFTLAGCADKLAAWYRGGGTS